MRAMGKYTSYGECSSTADLSSAVDDEDTTQAGVGVAIQNPQPAVAFIESVGSLAGICTTAAFLPQVWAVHITGDTSGLSLPMYCIFVFGVFLWIMYGLLKHAGSLVTANLITFLLAGYILSAIVVNTFFHSQKEQEIEDVLLDTANDALRLLPMVAVCAAGPAHTFTHPQVKKGLEEMLLQPGWDLFAALDVEAVYSELEDAKLHASLVAPSRVQAALSSLSAVDAVLFDASWASVATGECSLLDTAPSALAASVTSLAFGVQQCYEMVLRAERRRNVSYTHVVRVRPDFLWTTPLPPQRLWSSTDVLQPKGGGEDGTQFAVVPRVAFTYLRVYELLRGGCSSLISFSSPNNRSTPSSLSSRNIRSNSSSNSSSHSSHSSHSGHSGHSNHSGHSGDGGNGGDGGGDGGAPTDDANAECAAGFSAACLFRARLALDQGVSADSYNDGEPVRAPRIGLMCGSAGLRGESIDGGNGISPRLNAECL